MNNRHWRAGTLCSNCKELLKGTRKNQRFCTQKCQQEYHYNQCKNYIDKTFGTKCDICPETRYLRLHRKDGKKHRSWNGMTLNKCKERFKLDDYVRVCRMCHSGVHFCMTHMNLSYEQILEKIRMCGL